MDLVSPTFSEGTPPRIHLWDSRGGPWGSRRSEIGALEFVAYLDKAFDFRSYDKRFDSSRTRNTFPLFFPEACGREGCNHFFFPCCFLRFLGPFSRTEGKIEEGGPIRDHIIHFFLIFLYAHEKKGFAFFFFDHIIHFFLLFYTPLFSAESKLFAGENTII